MVIRTYSQSDCGFSINLKTEYLKPANDQRTRVGLSEQSNARKGQLAAGIATFYLRKMLYCFNFAGLFMANFVALMASVLRFGSHDLLVVSNKQQ